MAHMNTDVFAERARNKCTEKNPDPAEIWTQDLPNSSQMPLGPLAEEQKTARGPCGLILECLTSIWKVLDSNPSWVSGFSGGFISCSLSKNFSIYEWLLLFRIHSTKHQVKFSSIPYEGTHARLHYFWCDVSALAEHAMDKSHRISLGIKRQKSLLPIPSPSVLCYRGLAHLFLTSTNEQRNQSFPLCLYTTGWSIDPTLNPS